MARTIGSYGPKTMEAIRKAGLRLIFEHGYEAMSLRQLAGEVGIQAGSLYNHISTKQELLFDLIQDHINELLRQLDRAIEAVGRQRRQFQKGGAGIEQEVDAVAGQHLAAGGVALARNFAAAAGHFLQSVAQLRDKATHDLGIPCEFG